MPNYVDTKIQNWLSSPKFWRKFLKRTTHWPTAAGDNDDRDVRNVGLDLWMLKFWIFIKIFIKFVQNSMFFLFVRCPRGVGRRRFQHADGRFRAVKIRHFPGILRWNFRISWIFRRSSWSRGCAARAHRRAQNFPRENICKTKQLRNLEMIEMISCLQLLPNMGKLCWKLKQKTTIIKISNLK